MVLTGDRALMAAGIFPRQYLPQTTPTPRTGAVGATGPDLPRDAAGCDSAGPPMAATVPEALRAVPCWVTWEFRTKPGKDEQTKVPTNPRTGGMASTTNPETWGTFTEALAGVERHEADGIGFVFHEGNEFAGLDLDDCYDPDTRTLTPEAQALVDRLDSYTEISPSGRGVKVFVRAEVPRGKGFGQGNGLYSSGRFFTVTGQHLPGTPRTIEHRQAEVAALYAELSPPEAATPRPPVSGSAASEQRMSNEEVLRRCRASANREKFCTLYDAGAWETPKRADGRPLYASQSEADAALLSMLAFYTGPDSHDQLDELYRESALMRDKWDQQRGATTYGERTIGMVLDTKEEFYEPGGRPRREEHGAADAGAWEPPLPLTAQALPPFPTGALPDWLRDFVGGTARATQTPPDLAALLALSTLAAAVGGKARVQVKPGYSEPLNLYTVTVLPPASRKSAVFAAVAAPLHEWEAREAQRMAPVIAEGLAERELLEADLQRAKKAYEHAKTPEQRAVKKEDYLARKRELDAIRVPAAPRVTVDDVTPEKLASLMAEQGGSLAVMSAEGGVFEHMAGRYSNGVPNLDVYLKGHAGDPLRVDRQGRASEHIPSAALTMGLAVQPDVLRGLSRKPGFVGRGLMARFLYALPASTVGYRDTDPPPVPPPVSEAYRRKVAALCDLTPAQPGAETAPTPHVLTLSAEAYARYRQMERDREAMLRPV